MNLFTKAGHQCEVLKSDGDQSFTDMAAHAARGNIDIIVAGGGDGTINAVASAIVNHPTIRFGVLPLGTLNHFARDLGIPFELEAAIEVICAGHSEKVDVGMVNEQYFLNNSSVGLYPAIVKLRENLQGSGYSKWWAAFLASLRILRTFRRFRLEFEASNGLSIKRKTAMMFVGNNAYETNVSTLGQRTAINRGQLWINVPSSSSRWEMVMSMLTLVARRQKPQDMIIFETKSMTVNSSKNLLAVAADGEVVKLKLPLHYSILPKALDVLVPLQKPEVNK